jgi:hypothetical protein
MHMWRNLQNFWNNLGDDSRQAMIRTAFWMLLIVGTVYTISQSEMLQDDGPLALKIDMREKILIPRSNTLVNLPVTVKLQNNAAETALLEAPTPCKIIRWYITDDHGDFIQAPAEEVCSQVVIKANLPPGQYSEDEIEIPLDVQRYKADTRYRLSIRYWGAEAERKFKIEFE